jgi:glycosyltransferase involved in cell wall biosynthesis
LDILGSSYGMDVPLVLVGSPREAFSAAMQEITNLKLESKTRYLGYVPDQDMPYLFKLSRGLVLPTLFESLSIPMWEAFWLEVPVVCSNVCGLPEQAGAAAIFFDPYDPRDIARGIRELLLDPAKSRKLIHEGKQRIVNLNSENYANSWMELIRDIDN